MILSSQIIYRTCNIFNSRRRILWTKTKNFNQNKLNLISNLFYDSNKLLNNKILKFSNLKKLTFADCFNQEIKEGYLPSNLTQLTFGDCFVQEIKKGYLPSKLTQLTFGDFFNERIKIKEEYLPSNLTQLTFGRYRYSNQEIKEDIYHPNYEWSL